MHILTFDIEDWFQTHENRKHHSGHIWKDLPSRVFSNTLQILDVLDMLDRKASFFILGWVAEQHPKLVKEIQRRGHEIGTHSYWHHNANLLHPADFEKDLTRSISVLSDITGNAISMHRAPGFSLRQKDLWAFEILKAQGIRIDSSVQLYPFHRSGSFPVSIDNYDILEFPLIKSPFLIPYTGGGYFRALPEKILNHLFQEDRYRLLYFHPRDFDPKNPYTNLFSIHRNWLNNLNTGICMNRLKTILLKSPSQTMGQAAADYWNNKPVS